MKKYTRLLALMLSLALLVLSCFALAACTPEEEDDDNGGDGKVAYTVSVKDQYGNAVAGAKVQLYLDGVVPMGDKTAVDAEGKAVINLKEGNYSANVEFLPLGYAPYAGGKVVLENGTAAITVEAYPTYTVYVKDAAGNGVAGVFVQLCDDAGCKMPSATDATGKVVFKEPASNYKAQLSTVPAGYVKSEEKHAFTNNEVTIILVSAADSGVNEPGEPLDTPIGDVGID